MKHKPELRKSVHEALVAQMRAVMLISDAMTAVESLELEDPRYWAGREAVDHAVLLLAKGKWALGRAIGTYRGVAPITASVEDAIAGRWWCAQAVEVARRAAAGSSLEPGEAAALKLTSTGTEIQYCDGVPIVPSICPIVILRGSSYEMGIQYAQQILDVFGTFIFKQFSGRSADPHRMHAIKRWERELVRHTPELAEFSRGWAEGATAWGVPLDYWDVVSIWTGTEPPSTTPVGFRMPGGCEVRGIPESPALDAYLTFDPQAVADHVSTSPPCSGAAAWGDATAVGGAIAACSTDHDCTFQATIVAYPDDGHPFVYTPFAANGFIPGLGEFFLAGHPGMNAAGLAYVHHGGGFGMTEPPETWGYGIRRGAETFHNLRYASSARDALRADLTFPVGDAGYPLGFPGGFYVDSSYGFVIEGRCGVPDKPAPIVREESYDESGASYRFLYATNNAVSREAANSFGAPEEGFLYGTVEGWHTTLDSKLLKERSPEASARYWTAVSWTRNRYLFERLRERYGYLTLKDMIGLYEQGGPCRFAPRGDGEERRGFSAAHRGAAFTSAMEPQTGRYLGCVGPARRALAPMDGVLPPSIYHDETHEFWEISLAETPAELVAAARKQAADDVAAASARVSEVNGSPSAHGRQRAWLAEAQAAIAAGDDALAQEVEDVRSLGRAVRSFTRAQVRARQAARHLS
jgi:hypothetical protein